MKPQSSQPLISVMPCVINAVGTASRTALRTSTDDSYSIINTRYTRMTSPLLLSVLFDGMPRISLSPSSFIVGFLLQYTAVSSFCTTLFFCFISSINWFIILPWHVNLSNFLFMMSCNRQFYLRIYPFQSCVWGGLNTYKI